MRDITRGTIWLALLLLTSGCGGSGTSPVSPTPTSSVAPPAGLRLGSTLLSLTGAAAVGDGNGPIRTTCVPGSGPTGGMQHWSYGQLRAEADGWLFEGGQPAGSMTLRLRTGAAQGRGVSATGTFRGSSLDAGWGALFSPSGVRVETDGATFQGELAEGPGLTGSVLGTLVFVGSDGSRATCSEVRVQMVPWVP